MNQSGYIVNYGTHSRDQILSWLNMCMCEHPWQFNPHNLSCERQHGPGVTAYRWRLSVYPSIRRIKFANLQDVQLFVLVWGGEVIDLSSCSAIGLYNPVG